MSNENEMMQSWNSRSKKWVLFRPGVKAGIVEMRAEKYSDIPVKNGKSDDNEVDTKKDDPGNDSGGFLFW